MNKIEENLVKWKEIEAKVIARALIDEAFRTRLEQDPRETIETELRARSAATLHSRCARRRIPAK